MEMEISFPGGAKVDAQYAGHQIKTDQPPQGGGDGTAPTPFQLFLASLGTCAGIYVLGFCRQRNIPYENIKLYQRHEVDRSTGKVTDIELVIDLPDDFPEQYIDAVIRSADQCTVKKHLAEPPNIQVIAN